MVINIFFIKVAMPFFGAQVPGGEQVRQPGICIYIGWIRQQRRPVFQIQAAANNNAYTVSFGGSVGAYHAGKRIVIGDGNFGITECSRLCNEFFGVRTAS